MTRFITGLIRVYQKIQKVFTGQQMPLLVPAGCRSWPTCSEYTIQAVQEYGSAKGLALGVLRVLKCNPFFGPQH